MATDEAARHHLYEHARTTWDDEAARTLMSALPWDVRELATKQDLQAGLDRTKWSLVVTLATINATLVGIVVAAVQLLR